jgi:acyl-CoA synthetase (AMP-forming)/AMP-acid ligase II
MTRLDDERLATVKLTRAAPEAPDGSASPAPGRRNHNRAWTAFDPAGAPDHGRPAPLTEARIQDAAGNPLPADTEGEIAVRGPNVMLGYLNGDGLEGGWFRTGDAGRKDAEGRFHFIGRGGGVIISGGENIYPAELERLLASAPGILEGAICGVPNPRWGEVPVVGCWTPCAPSCDWPSACASMSCETGTAPGGICESEVT